MDSQFRVESLALSGNARLRLNELVSLVTLWNPRINLVSRSSLEHIWERHIADSLQILSFAPDRVGSWCDLGSGGGFPGLVVAILAAERPAAFRVTLVESDARKAAFLSVVGQKLDLGITVLNRRIEHVSPMYADVVSARALAPLKSLCGFAYRHLATDGVAIFPKGANHLSEIDEARADWQFDCEVQPSRTEAMAAILLLRSISHV